MAAAVMLRLLSRAGREADVEVSSAGTGGWHVGEGADPRAQDVLTRHGYDASEHKARQFTRRCFDEFDLVLAVDRETLSNLRNIAPPNADGKLRLLREFDPQAGRDLDVPDPNYGGRRGFDEVLAMVEVACRGLVEHIQKELDA